MSLDGIIRRNISFVGCILIVAVTELNKILSSLFRALQGGGPRVVVSTAAFHARVRGLAPGLGGLKETKMFLPHPRLKINNVGSLSNPVSGGQCHLNHLTILRRFSWPSLAYMCTKVA